MNEKQKIIKQMLQMQKKFITLEKTSGIELENYYASDAGTDLADYQGKFNELANRLIDLAHEEKGSNR